METSRDLRLLADRHIRGAEPIQSTPKELRLEPSILNERCLTFDIALTRLQYLLVELKEAIPATHYSNLTKLKTFEISGVEFSKTINWLSRQSQRNEETPLSTEEAQTNQTAEPTFSTVAQYILSGEWGYVYDITDSSQVVSALIIEGWGAFLEELTGIDGIRSIFVRAIEEVLGTEFPDSELWQDVKPWVIEEAELFSPEFIDFIQK